MDLFKQVKKTVLESVGIGENIPEDPAIASLKQKTNHLDGIVSSLKKNFNKYSSTMGQLAQASAIMANEVTQFYARSKTRAKSIEKFSEANLKLEVISNELFRDEFHRDVLVLFDQWHRKVQGISDEIKQAEDLHCAMFKQEQKIRNVKDGKGGSKKEGPSVQDLEHEYDSLKSRLDYLKKKLDGELNQSIENRYNIFDNILVRVMECQVEFFNRSAACLEPLKPNIENYRKRFPKGTLPEGLTSSSANTSGSNEKPSNAEEKKPVEKKFNPTEEKKAPILQQKSNVSSAAEEEDDDEEEELEESEEESDDEVELKSKPQPQNMKSSTSSTQADLLGEFISAPSSNSKKNNNELPKKPSTNPTEDLFGFVSAPSANASQAQSQKPKAPSQSKDPIDLFSAFDSKPVQNKPAVSKEDFLMEKPQAKVKPVKSAPSSGRGNPKSSSSSPSPTHKPAPKPVKPATAVPANAQRNENGEIILPDDPSVESKSAPAIKVVLRKEQKAEIDQKAAEAVDDYKRRAEAEAQMNNDKRDLRIALEKKLDDWEFKQGVRKNIRTLLSTVHSVMWEGSGMKPIDLSSLMSDAGVKKAHRNAILVCHPDRAKGDAEKEVIAERVFNALNVQYELFKNGGQA
jgi:hypothetical protein